VLWEATSCRKAAPLTLTLWGPQDHAVVDTEAEDEKASWMGGLLDTPVEPGCLLRMMHSRVPFICHEVRQVGLRLYGDPETGVRHTQLASVLTRVG
jgi:hypothetical protein